MPEHDKRTRQELDSALRKLLKRRPLEQLRIRELTELCGLRRQSFYYHFKDIPALLEEIITSLTGPSSGSGRRCWHGRRNASPGGRRC